MKLYFIALTMAVLLPGVPKPLSAQSVAGYNKEIAAWHQNRITNLKKEDGWLNLAGLFWLQQGNNSFGSAATNQVVFPAGTIPAMAGHFKLDGRTVTLVATDTAAIQVDGKYTKEAVIFSTDSVRAPVVSHGNLKWTVIQRGNKIGIRLRNLKSTQLNTFKGIDRFATNTKWRVTASLQTATTPQHIKITNVLGQTNEQPSPGKLKFTISGKAYTLDALEEDGGLFIIFADATSGNETYPSGRFLFVEKPGADGKTIIDFNKAYNPPCAFTPYATCPLPPKQNVLPVAVTAGEKKYHYTAVGLLCNIKALSVHTGSAFIRRCNTAKP